MARPKTQTVVGIETLSLMVEQLTKAGIPVPENVQAQLDAALASSTLTKLASFSKSMKDDGNSNEVLNRYPVATLNVMRTLTKSVRETESPAVYPAPLKGYRTSWNLHEVTEYLRALTEWGDEFSAALAQLATAVEDASPKPKPADDAAAVDAPRKRIGAKA